MEILYHHRTQGQGAEGIHIRGIIKAFEDLGHHVRVVSPFRATPKKTLEFKRSRLWKILSEQAPQVIFEIIEITYNIYCYFALRSAIHAIHPDFIYDRYALFNVAPLLIARRYNIKLVLEINDATIIQRSRPLFLKRLARWFERKIYCNAQVLLTVSEHFKELIVSTYGISPSKIYVIPNAIDPARFHISDYHNFRTELGLNNKTVIGVIGAFVSWHGLDFLITSVQNLLKKREDLKILLVGDGPVRPQIDTLVKRLGLQEYIEFTRFVPPHNVPKYISCMDICLMPDSNEHGSPIKIFEYMATAKPVVAPRYGPIEEIIQHNKTGILFTPREKIGLSNAIQSLLDDSELRHKLGTAARNYVFSHHTWTINAQRILSILQQSFK